MPDKRWKAAERECAKELGTTRNPSNGTRNNDIDAGPFAVEFKSTLRPLSFIRSAMHQAAEGAKKRDQGQTPIVVIYAGKGHKRERYVMMRFNDWRDWFGNLEPKDPIE